jgi:hypothetical protein
MRISEITDAQGQLELLRTVIDNTWTAIAQQAEQERRSEAERKAKAKLKQRGNKSIKGTSVSIPIPPLPSPTILQAPLSKQLPSPLDKPNPNTLNFVKPQPSTNFQLKQQIPKTEIDLKSTKKSHPKSSLVSTVKPQIDLKKWFYDRPIDTTDKPDDGDDRHS